ncbi:MAG: DUF2339 domain-containing protein [Lentisphaeria bacterium]|nr:DUF2339 domain-containing protein [Lentisphaeria bacterium]
MEYLVLLLIILSILIFVIFTLLSKILNSLNYLEKKVNLLTSQIRKQFFDAAISKEDGSDERKIPQEEKIKPAETKHTERKVSVPPKLPDPRPVEKSADIKKLKENKMAKKESPENPDKKIPADTASESAAKQEEMAKDIVQKAIDKNDGSAKVKVKKVQPDPDELSDFENNAILIMKKIWNWIIVGEDHNKQNSSIEYAVATAWLMRISIVILLSGLGFFLKYGIDHNFIGPTARVSISLLAGIAMLISGMKLIPKKYHLIGLGLIGGGICALYFSIFAASSGPGSGHG